MLKVEQLSVEYGGIPFVKDISFTLEENQWLMVVGPNGAGKSTLVNAISQSIPFAGSVHFDGQNLARAKPAALARMLGVLGQSQHVAYSFTVGEIVRLGRYAWAPGLFSSRSDEDERSVQAALAATGMQRFEHQSALTLSGGELQRAFLAQVFAQDPKLLILDEPTNHLDLVYQKQVFELIGRWVQQPGRSVLSVVHDLNLAHAYGTTALLMHEGRAVSSGRAADVLTRENLADVYGMDVHGWMRELLAHWD